jgi:hypothetical protein
MTLADALRIAEQVNPKHRQRFNKLQTGISVGQFAADVAALSKSYGAMGGTVAVMQKQLNRARAGIALYADAMNINTTETMQ